MVQLICFEESRAPILTIVHKHCILQARSVMDQFRQPIKLYYSKQKFLKYTETFKNGVILKFIRCNMSNATKYLVLLLWFHKSFKVVITFYSIFHDTIHQRIMITYKVKFNSLYLFLVEMELHSKLAHQMISLRARERMSNIYSEVFLSR